MTEDKNIDVKVEKMISSKEADKYDLSLGGMGGFFKRGMRWQDYIDSFMPKAHPYAEAFRKYVVENKIREGGDWHQYSPAGTPLFSDKTVGVFSYRAWGDIMAAIWSEEEDADYSYMDFYMSL